MVWFSAHQRDLPWRRTTDPYAIAVSEFMLQQTQVSRVTEKYLQFLEQFPTIQDLAVSSPVEVIRAWSGLGYNRRALLLHHFAQAICTEHHGVVPSARDLLLSLPGVGPYLAGAIASFVFNLPEPAVDVNVRRVFSRYFWGKDQGKPFGKKEENSLFSLVREHIPLGRSANFHGALMDFGSLICTRDAPHCSSCPLQQSCSFASLYLREGKKVLAVMEKKEESGIRENGKFIPNRIFRGRIVEFARKNENQVHALVEFGKKIKLDFATEEMSWLVSLCKSLQRDRLLDFSIDNDVVVLRFPRK
ncbi:A/G-specific adenine glycosylase [Candidatus Woesearchaeota archaeon]|nr:A/G-specific adenine glycosylase [Candidatus Woesearchaeota archaeon]